MTDQVNSTLLRIEDLFKSLVWDSLFKVGLNALFADVPWLNIWPLRQIVTVVAKHFSEIEFNNLKMTTDIAAIPIINAEHKKSFEAACLQLQIIAHDRGTDSPEFIQAREHAKADLSRFVHFNG